MKTIKVNRDLIKRHAYFNNKFFARWAPYYDIITIFIGPLRMEAVKTFGLPKNAKVLDVACGTGSQAAALAKIGYDVTGIDLSPDMLRVAQKKIESNLKLSFLQMDATDLSFKSHSFDGASISFGLHDMPPHIGLAVLKEMKRVTKKGNTILIVDYLEPYNHWLTNVVYPFIRHFETPNYVPFVTKGLESILKEAGLTIVKKQYWHGLFQIVIAKNL